MPYYFFRYKNPLGPLPNMGYIVEAFSEDDAWVRIAPELLARDGDFSIEDLVVKRVKGFNFERYSDTEEFFSGLKDGQVGYVLSREIKI